MPDILDDVIRWAVPAAVVFGTTALLVAIIVWVVRRSRRGPRARAAAEAERVPAGVALVALDDAVGELDLEGELSGALYGGEAAASLRRARMNAQHARDTAFADYRRTSSADVTPAEARALARRVRIQAEKALADIHRTQAEHGAWVTRNVSAGDQVAAARARLMETTQGMGDPENLVADLRARFDEGEVTDAASAAESAAHSLAEAGRLLERASARAGDPSLSALPDLAAAERALRAGMEASRVLEETHRLVTQAATAVPGEIAALREAVHAAHTTRSELEPADADRLAAAIRDAEDAVSALELTAARRPTATIDALARIRGRLDLALGDARSAQQRLRGARSALPGTLAAARTAVAHAEAATARSGSGADVRVRLASAQEDLALARQAADPVEALDLARRAMRLAEDAKALADYDRLGRD